MKLPQEATKYLGVYLDENRENFDGAHPYVGYIKLPKDKYFPDQNGDVVTQLNIGYFWDPTVAARVFNMYAILFYGEDAIINADLERTPGHEEEWKNFICGRQNRARNYRRAREKALDLLEQGVKFKKYEPQNDAPF